MKNDLILERSDFITGMYTAQMHIEGIYFTSSGWTWLETINNLLGKINWFYRGHLPASEEREKNWQEHEAPEKDNTRLENKE